MFVTKAEYNRLKAKCLDQTRELVEVKRERDALRKLNVATSLPPDEVDPGEWIPEYGQTYYWITEVGNIFRATWCATLVDFTRLESGRCYRTYKEADDVLCERRKTRGT